MKRRIQLVLFAMMFMLFATSLTVYAENFAISQTKATVNVGDTIDLDVTGTEKTPKWTSWNVNTVRVNQDGEVTAIRTGKTTVSARVGLSVKKCTVTVVGSSVKLNKSTATIYSTGTSTKTVQLKATVKGASKAVTWTSSDESVATVDDKGKVTSVSAGEAIITAKANDKTASCVVTVKESSIFLNMDTMHLSTKGSGSAITLKPTIIGSSKSVKWTTSDKKVATVSSGKVTGKGTGTATITATANGISTTCTVNVIKNVISIGSEKELLYVGESKQLKSNAAKKDVIAWTSSNEAVATVDSKGKVSATGAGKATICIERNGETDTCEITVKDTSTSIGEDVIELRTKGTDKTYILGYEIIGRSTSVKWTTSDKNIATVSKGKVTAKKAGSVTITATANGISDTVEVVVRDYIPTIKLNQSEYMLYTGKGNTLTLTATVDGPSKKVTWNTSDASVATVNTKGKVTALKEGTALITATANEVTAECLITVTESKVLLETQNIHLEKGQKAELPVDVVGNSQTVTYTSTNTKVATVSKGVITAKNYGEVDIKVKANGVTSVCHVSVDECVHSFDEGVTTTEPTCIAEGVKTFTCTKCGNTYTETIEKTEHAWVETQREEATCVRSGIIIYTCENCPETKQEFTELGEHSFGEWMIVTEATEFSEGLEKRTCNYCPQEETRPIAIREHEHVYAEVITEPTCLEQGYTTHTCRCEDTYIDNYVDALGHDFGEWETVTEATEEAEGLEKRTCKREGCKEEETRAISKKNHEHVYESVVTEPTCTEKGFTTHTCRCGDSYADTYVDALGHDFGEWEMVTEATEEAEGLEKRTCKREGCKEEETRAISKLDHEHKYESVVTEPTCTEKGFTTHICRCGDSYIDNYVDAVEHEYNTVYIKNEPTCTEAGWTLYMCKCGNTEKRDIVDKLGHNYETVITKEATCTEKGTKQKQCTRCDLEPEISYIPIIGHSYVEVENTISEETGIGHVTKECNMCKKAISEYSVSIKEPQMSIYDGETYQLELISDLDEKLLPYVSYSFQAYNGYGKRAENILTVSDTGLVTVDIEEYGDTSLLFNARIKAVLKDNPYGAVLKKSQQCTLKIMEYEENLAFKKAKNEIVPQIISGDMNDVEKVLAVYEWLTGNVQYDYEPSDYGAYGAIYNRASLSTGYAKAFDIFMRILDIPSILVRSTKLNGAWNMVQLDGEWYWLDASLDSNGIGYCGVFNHFLCNGVRAEDQRGYYVDFLPDCNGNKWRVELFEEYHVTTQEEIIDKMFIQKDKERIKLVFHSEEEYMEYKEFKKFFIQKFSYEAAQSVTHFENLTTEEKYYEDYYIVQVKGSNSLSGALTVLKEEENHVHVFEDHVVEAKCLKNGYKGKRCYCGYMEDIETIPALGHDWGEWEIVKEPTVTDKGEEKRTCKRCSVEDTRVIDKHVHSYDYEQIITEPTCTEQGYTTHICSCGNSYKNTFVASLGHDWGEWEIIKEATETEGVEEKRICNRCFKEETRATEDHEHVYQEIITEPTCTEQGYTTHICSCEKSYVDTYVPALGHDEGTWTITVEPQLGIEGKEELHCNRCGTLLDEKLTEMLMTDGTDHVYIVDSPDGPAVVVGHYGSDEEVNKMFELVNTFREENGKQPLTMNYEYLVDGKRGAKERAVTTANYWEHWNYSYSENIAYTPAFYSDYDDMEMVTRVFDSWVASGGHKSNMLSAGAQNYETGISVFYKKVHNGYERYWVQVFE